MGDLEPVTDERVRKVRLALLTLYGDAGFTVMPAEYVRDSSPLERALDWLAFHLMDIAAWVDGDIGAIHYDKYLGMRLDGTWDKFWSLYNERWCGWRYGRYV